MKDSFEFDISKYIQHDGTLDAVDADDFSHKLGLDNFSIQRIFWISNVPTGASRANHACLNADIVLITVCGSLEISIENRNEIKTYELKEHNAIYVPSGCWIKVCKFDDKAILLGLSNKTYKDCEYINDYETFKGLSPNIKYNE